MKPEQAKAIADGILGIERERLESLRQSRARPPSFIYQVSGLRSLPPSTQEELFTQAKWNCLRNWRFVGLMSLAIGLEGLLLWLLLSRTDPLAYFVFVAMSFPILASALSVYLVRAELKRLLILERGNAA